MTEAPTEEVTEKKEEDNLTTSIEKEDLSMSSITDKEEELVVLINLMMIQISNLTSQMKLMR